jgi:hypothetical protein
MNTATDSLVQKFPVMGGQPAVAALAGTLTGTVDGTIADVPAATAAGGEATAAELTATNTAITSVNLQLKELQTKLNELIADVKSGNIVA